MHIQYTYINISMKCSVRVQYSVVYKVMYVIHLDINVLYIFKIAGNRLGLFS